MQYEIYKICNNLPDSNLQKTSTFVIFAVRLAEMYQCKYQVRL